MPADPFFEGPSRKRKKITNNLENNSQSVKRPGALSGGAPSERRRQALKQSNTKSKKEKVDESESDDELGPGGIDDMDLEGYGEGGDYEDEAKDTENRETAAEKRLRLAKGYIENLKRDLGGSGEYDAADIDRDLIAERINDDALETAGRLHRNVAGRYTFPINESAIRSSRGHQLAVTCVAVDEHMKVIYTGSKDGSIIKWDFKTGQKQHVFLGGRKGIKHYVGHTDHILSLAVSPDGRFLASGGRDRIINIWSVQDNKHLHTFRHHKDGVSGLSFRKGSNQLYSCSLDRSVKLWDLDQMAYIETLFGHQDTVFAIDTLVKERAVTAGGRDRTVRMWKIVEESQLLFRGGGVAKQHGIQEVEPNSGGVKKREKRDATNIAPGFLEGSIDVVALIDEDNFLSGGDSGGLALWNVDKKKPLFSLDSAHGVDPESNTPRWITALATLRYTDMFASGSWDGTVRVWKLTRGLRSFSHIAAIPVPGFINGLRLVAPPGSEGAATEAHIIAAVGQEHRMGRWKRIKEAKNGLTVIPLNASTSPIALTMDT